jgi:tetratricopeptide (TPR) repeat protein
MNPDNPIIKLCLEGMQAEGQGRFEDASSLFQRAWEVRKDDFDACVAAHFLARHQQRPQDALYWNQQALKFADAVGDKSVRSFYPSLYLNLGYSHEVLGDWVEARKYYDLAAEKAGELPEGRYGDLVRSGIAQGRKRTGL